MLVEDDRDHDYTKKNREAIYAFFQKHLENPGDPVDKQVPFLSREELRVTSTGQLIDSLGGETVFSLNRRDSEVLVQKLQSGRKDISRHIEGLLEKVSEISGYETPGELSGVVFRGRYERQGYDVEMYAIAGEASPLPLLYFKPTGVDQFPAVLYLHPEGKGIEALEGGEIESLVKLGYAVLAPDLPGSGELGTAGNRTAFLAVQIGRSLVGIRAGDIVRCVRFLESQDEINSSRIVGIARGGMAVSLLHAAALEPAIGQIALIDPLISYQKIVTNRFYDLPAVNLIANVLTGYDLPDLQASLAPRPLLVISPRDHLGNRMAVKAVQKELGVVYEAYEFKNASEHLTVQHLEAFDTPIDTITNWLGTGD
jgi:hypothetical protein